jgi:hypothetical protein
MEVNPFGKRIEWPIGLPSFDRHLNSAPNVRPEHAQSAPKAGWQEPSTARAHPRRRARQNPRYPHRIAYLMRKGVAPGNILGVTFTNKAAREMQERVRKLIPDPRRRAETQTRNPTAPPSAAFHSLCVRILQTHRELGYKRNFVIYDESEQLGAIKKILANISAKGERPTHLPFSLQPVQKRWRTRRRVFGDPAFARWPSMSPNATSLPSTPATPGLR